nr:unnamed protein product [Callosobruchus chinensis]
MRLLKTRKPTQFQC